MKVLPVIVAVFVSNLMACQSYGKFWDPENAIATENVVAQPNPISFFTFLGGTGVDKAYSIRPTSDGYVLAGSVSANIPSIASKTPINAYTASVEGLVAKLDQTGNLVWYTFLGSSLGDELKSVRQTTDGGYIVSGYSGANIANIAGVTPLIAHAGGTSDGLVAKLNADGTVIWYTFLGGTGTDEASFVEQTLDGGFIVSGYGAAIPTLGGQSALINHAGSQDMLIVKMNAAGGITWYTLLGGTTSEIADKICQTADGGFLAAGFGTSTLSTLDGQSVLYPYSANFDALMIKLTATGSVAWYGYFGGAGGDRFVSVSAMPDGGAVLTGYTTGVTNIASPLLPYSGSFDMLVAKVNSSGGVEWFTHLGSAALEQPLDIVATTDGGMLVAGYGDGAITALGGLPPTYSHQMAQDALLIRLTAAGSVSGYTFWGGAGNQTANSVAITSDGGAIFAGSSAQNITSFGGKTPVNAFTSSEEAMAVKFSKVLGF